jgi:hypothetical protein
MADWKREIGAITLYVPPLFRNPLPCPRRPGSPLGLLVTSLRHQTPPSCTWPGLAGSARGI